jgi:hypothetical protein
MTSTHGSHESKAQSTYNHITHLELVDKALEEERCTPNTQATMK